MASDWLKTSQPECDKIKTQFQSLTPNTVLLPSKANQAASPRSAFYCDRESRKAQRDDFSQLEREAALDSQGVGHFQPG